VKALRAWSTWLLLCGLGGSALAAPPPPGLSAGELCVSVADAAASCGPVELRWRDRSRVQLQVSDIVYRLRLHSSQVEVTLMHGSMQIDEFTATYEWHGEVLRFDDIAKRTRYELRPMPRPATPG
jgi:hypothetical protein